MDKKEQFLAKLKSIFGESAQQIIEKISQPKKYFSFRVNNLVSQKKLDFASAGPFENSYFLPIENKNLVTNDGGEIYIQSFSSMFAVQTLGVQAGDVVLDMCAAPGGKSAYAAALANNEIKIVALDNNISRINAMRENFKTLNVKDFETKKMDAGRAQSDLAMISRFDKIICDVPCSNEGLIRDLDNQDFSFWNPKTAKHLPMLQKKILASAINCLKPGGTLVYSTCTFSPEENEEVVDWALKKFSDMSLLEITNEKVPTINGFTQWKNKTFDSKLSLTKRILPDEKFDGFFVAKLFKR